MASDEDKLNILLILTDQQRVDTLGCYGAPICRTPHLDHLAQQGVRFTQAYTATIPCSPSRAALFSGAYPHRNQVTVNGCALNPNLPNLASELRRAGYRLGYAGKWHVDQAKVPSEYGFIGQDIPGYGYPPPGVIEGVRFGSAQSPATRLYAHYLRERGYPAPRLLEAFYGDNPGVQSQEIYALQSGDIEMHFESMVVAETIELLHQFTAARERDGSPFFVWANFWGPHTPCLLPDPYYSLYAPDTVPDEPSFAESWQRKPFVQHLYERYWGLSSGGWAGWRTIIARYWGYVTMLDELIGRILAEVRALGLAENTLIVVSTDHGDMMGAHRLIEKGPFTYDQCYRLPLIAVHPRCQAAGHVCDEFVYLHDLFPTFLDVAGVNPPDGLDGQSILANILGRDQPTGRESIFAAFTGHIFPYEQRMVRTRTHKLVYNRADIGELYDLVDDPWEMTNRIDLPDTRAIQRELLELLRGHLVRLGDPLLPAFDRIRHVY